ncbi:helix-turn-helix domain-containing protein [Microbacterium aurantiacum]|uniref:helix-turn-helix domain-containing protein n=1 Tax=Microbacterium aurantiacum TaxID=162393 RepID=UPI0040357CF4
MSDSLGARLREVRTARGLSLRSVAQALGVSASLLSQVEIGRTQPSVSTLFALAAHLGVSLDDLVGQGGAAVDASDAASPPPASPRPAATTVQRSHDYPVIEMENGVRWEKLAATADGPADALLVTYQPGASSSIEGKLMRHAGVEYAYLLEGELTLQLEFDTFTLGAGDSLSFDSMRPHMFSNVADRPAKGVWFVFGRRAHNLAAPTAPGILVEPAVPASAVDVLRAMERMD